MSSDYPGVAGNVTAHEAPTVTVPDDGDDPNAAALNPAPKTLADFVAFLQAYAVLCSPNSGVNVQIVSLEGTATGPAIRTHPDAHSATRTWLWDIEANAGENAHLYRVNATGAVEAVFGCFWNNYQAYWVPDDADHAFLFKLVLAGPTGPAIYRAPYAATFVDGAWVAVLAIDSSGNLALASKKITGVATPAADTDAATKGYVDTLVGAQPAPTIIYPVPGTGTGELLNNWVPTDGTTHRFGYYKDHEGRVHFVGGIKDGTSSQVMVMPSGYRSAKCVSCPVWHGVEGAVFAYFNPADSTLNTYGSGATSPTSMDGMSYLADGT